MSNALPWIKVFKDLPTHPKMQHLELIVGPRAFDHTVRALLWIAQYRPTGDISNIKPEVLEAATRWDGTRGQLHAAWVETGFIESDTRRWHDWGDVQDGHVEHDARKKQASSRQKKKRERDSVSVTRDSSVTSVTVTRDKSVTSLSLSPSSDLADQESVNAIAEPVPEFDDSPIVSAWMPGTRTVYGQKRYDMFKAEESKIWPKCTDDVMRAIDPATGFHLGEAWTKRFPCLDGRNGRPDVPTVVARCFVHWTTTMLTQGKDPWIWPEPAIGNFTSWLEGAHTKAKQDRKMDDPRRAPDNDDIAAIAGKSNRRPPPVFDDDMVTT